MLGRVWRVGGILEKDAEQKEKGQERAVSGETPCRVVQAQSRRECKLLVSVSAQYWAYMNPGNGSAGLVPNMPGDDQRIKWNQVVK